jgi:hypothetical protein
MELLRYDLHLNTEMLKVNNFFFISTTTFVLR